MQSQQVSRSTWPSRWLTRAAAKEAGEWVAHMSRGPWSWELSGVVGRGEEPGKKYFRIEQPAANPARV